MPVFAVDILDVGASGLGLLYSVSGVGALLGIFVVGSLGSIQRKGLLPIGGATLYGGFLTLFAVSTWFPLSLAALFLLDLFSSIYMISVQTTLQVMVPDVLRGRVMGIYGMSWSVGPLGALQAGAIASLLGAPASASISGVLVAAFALIVASSNAKVPPGASACLRQQRPLAWGRTKRRSACINIAISRSGVEPSKEGLRR